MIVERPPYRLLIVSSSEKFTAPIRAITEERGYGCTVVTSIADAKHALHERSFDFVVINSPLPDEAGIRFALHLSADKRMVCLLFVKTDLHDEVRAKVGECGIFTLSKPTSALLIRHALNWMEAVCARLGKLEKKATTIEEKMEEIRVVNRAKWLLIENLAMSESEAHRYIEKQAMDRCVTRREVAEEVLRTYR